MEEIMKFQTEQEEFWAGDFGNSFTTRNTCKQYLYSDIHFFSNVFRCMQKFNTLIEFGAGIGLNLQAIRSLIPDVTLDAVEINAKAAETLKKNADHVFVQSLLDFIPQMQYDVVLCKAVLIHINPDHLQETYDKIYATARRYIIIGELYNPSPVMVNYRGNIDRLFKRDFPGELMDAHPDLKLIDYGFQYYRDPNFPMGDVNWFLLEKTL